MQTRIGRIVSILIGVALIVAGMAALAGVLESRLAQLPGTPVAKQLPEVTVTAIDGRELALSDLRGRPVLINFWATWCPPCREEMPALERIEKRWKERGAAVVVVNFEEDGDTIRQYLAANGLALAVYQDEQGIVAEQLDITYLPTTLLVDAGGVIRSRTEGPLSAGQMEAGLRFLMKESKKANRQ